MRQESFFFPAKKKKITSEKSLLIGEFALSVPSALFVCLSAVGVFPRVRCGKTEPFSYLGLEDAARSPCMLVFTAKLQLPRLSVAGFFLFLNKKTWYKFKSKQEESFPEDTQVRTGNLEDGGRI